MELSKIKTNGQQQLPLLITPEWSRKLYDPLTGPVLTTDGFCMEKKKIEKNAKKDHSQTR